MAGSGRRYHRAANRSSVTTAANLASDGDPLDISEYEAQIRAVRVRAYFPTESIC
jgi:hypothetical protein